MQDAPPSGRLPAGIWKIVSVAAIGAFMSQLDATIVNVSLPDLASTLHAPFSTVQWVVSGYLLALALALPLNGWLVDRFGGRTIYLGCFAGFTVTSALCALAWSAPSLIAFRILQGMAGGLLAPMAQMTIARAAGKDMPRVASAVTLPILLAPLLGPVVAGGILSVASWRWIFLINLPFGLIALLLASMFLPDDRQECRPRRLDIAGLMLLSPALIALLYGTDHMGQRTGQGLLCLAVVMGILYLRQAHRKGERALIDLALFRAPIFSASALIMFMLNGVAFAGQMLLPVWLIHACGIPAERTGWFMAPLGLGMMCAYPLTGRLTGHFGIRRLTRFGAICSGLGTLMLAMLAFSGFSIFVLAIALFLRGAGTGVIGIPAMSAGYASVAPAEIPMATVALNIVQRIGGPTLTTLCATLLGWRLSHATTPPAVSLAFTAAFGLLCVFHGLLFLTTFRLPKGMPRRPPP